MHVSFPYRLINFLDTFLNEWSFGLAWFPEVGLRGKARQLWNKNNIICLPACDTGIHFTFLLFLMERRVWFCPLNNGKQHSLIHSFSCTSSANETFYWQSQGSKWTLIIKHFRTMFITHVALNPFL